jgi:PIN domain nuclease of toxin-antitoxin system
MNILLDTHVALWAIVEDPRLPAKARTLIASQSNTIWISAASLWEIAIKHSLGHGDMPVSSRDALGYFLDAGYRLLPVNAEHAAAVEDLPPLHQDPFDRLLVAQAIVEPLRLLTADGTMARYSDAIIRV